MSRAIEHLEKGDANEQFVCLGLDYFIAELQPVSDYWRDRLGHMSSQNSRDLFEFLSSRVRPRLPVLNSATKNVKARSHLSSASASCDDLVARVADYYHSLLQAEQLTPVEKFEVIPTLNTRYGDAKKKMPTLLVNLEDARRQLNCGHSSTYDAQRDEARSASTPRPGGHLRTA